jgi:putative ABC transport system permease protein
VGGGTLPALVDPAGPIPEATYVALRRAGWRVSPVVEGGLLTEGGRVRLIGLDPLTAPPGTDAAEVALDDPTAFFTPPGLLLAAPATAARLTGPDLPPVVESPGLAPGIAFADIGTAQRLLGLEGRLTRLILLPDQPLSRPPLAAIAPGLEERPPESGADLARLTDSFHLNLTAFGLLSFAVGLFIVHGAIGLAFEQRRPVFRTLRALGVPARTLVALLALELLILATLAALLGMAPRLPHRRRAPAGRRRHPPRPLRRGGRRHPHPPPRPGGPRASPSRSRARPSPPRARSGRSRASPPSPPPSPAPGHAPPNAPSASRPPPPALILAALALGPSPTGLLAAFALMGLLLVAAALLLPAALSLALAALSRTARGPLSEWFWADTRQQLPGLSLALMALLLALAANIGVGTMVSSFRLTFTGWLDQRLASELYVTASTPEEVPALLAFLEPRTDAILPIWNVDTEILGAPAELYGVADHPTYRENWPLLAALPDAWDRIARARPR